ncbi:MAG: DUF996 domain-containing protein [Candidatus Bathyarchaeia archaeon]
MTLESSKTLGGIGALLMFIGVLPYINYFGIIPLIGAILVLISLHGFARIYKESGIFDNALYGIIAGIVGVVLAVAIGIAIILPNIKDFLMKLFPSWNGSWSTIQSLSGMTPNTSNITFGDVIPFITAAIVILVILWVFAILATFFVRRSLKQLSTRTNVGLFSTTGMLLLIGAVLIIAFGLGLLLLWIATLILAIAFFTMKPKETQPPTT